MTRFTAELEDPTTGEFTRLEADTEAELDQLVDKHFAAAYPENSNDD